MGLRLGALEAGGTKMVCSIGTADGTVLERMQLPTTLPEETMPGIIQFFKEREIAALGIGSFGPVDLRRDSKTFGHITTTPKLPWQWFPIMQRLQDGVGVPVAIDTDVNAAALGEVTYGAAKGLKSCVYVTVGTGVGAGVYIEGNLMHGLVHSELGHMLIRPEADDPTPKGFCPFHDGCLEGLASGPAIEKRWGVKAHELAPDHPAWTLETSYLSQMCANIITCMSPERIILGGGVMGQAHLFPRVRAQTQALLNSYIHHELVLSRIDEYIVPPGLLENSGVTGALLLAQAALNG